MNQEANIGDIFSLTNSMYLIVDIEEKRNDVQLITMLNIYTSQYQTYVSPFRGLDERWKYIA